MYSHIKLTNNIHLEKMDTPVAKILVFVAECGSGLSLSLIWEFLLFSSSNFEVIDGQVMLRQSTL